MAILSNKIKAAAQGLRDKLKNPGVGTETAKARQGAALGQAKAATGPSGQTNVGEILATQDAQMQGQQAAEQLEGQAAQAQVAEQAQESQERMFDAGQRAQALEADANYSQALDAEFNKYEQFSLDMDEAEEDLALEKLGFQLMLKDKQYLSQLDQNARMARLKDDLNYRKEAADQVMGEKYASTLRNLGFLELQHGLDLKNTEELAKIDLNSAMAAANAALADELSTQRSEAYIQLGKAGSKVISGLNEKNKKKEE